MANITIEKKVFRGKINNYIFIAWYLTNCGDSLVRIKKGKTLVKQFLFPSYKIWNIAAHANDIVIGLDKENDSGLYIAGSDGLGGNSYANT